MLFVAPLTTTSTTPTGANPWVSSFSTKLAM
jgi:hypothetical protein